MAVTDLTNTTWIINAQPSILGSGSFNINFISNEIEYTSTYQQDMPRSRAGIYYVNALSEDKVYDNAGNWLNNDEDFRTIEITGGTDVTNSNLIAWLEENATQISLPDSKSLVTYEDLLELKSQLMNIILSQYKCGYYDNDAMYDAGDIVFYNKKLYVCIDDSLGGNLPTNTNYWEPLIV